MARVNHCFTSSPCFHFSSSSRAWDKALGIIDFFVWASILKCLGLWVMYNDFLKWSLDSSEIGWYGTYIFVYA